MFVKPGAQTKITSPFIFQRAERFPALSLPRVRAGSERSCERHGEPSTVLRARCSSIEERLSTRSRKSICRIASGFFSPNALGNSSFHRETRDLLNYVCTVWRTSVGRSSLRMFAMEYWKIAIEEVRISSRRSVQSSVCGGLSVFESV